MLAAPNVPIRRYSDAVIAQLGDETFQAAVYENMVSEEGNVRLVVTKVVLGEADAGIVYASDVTPNLADELLEIPIPDELNVRAEYPIVALADSERAESAKDFIDFVLSPEGQAILETWGFGGANR